MPGTCKGYTTPTDAQPLVIIEETDLQKEIFRIDANCKRKHQILVHNFMVPFTSALGLKPKETFTITLIQIDQFPYS